jgi:hypothetical protein
VGKESVCGGEVIDPPECAVRGARDDVTHSQPGRECKDETADSTTNPAMHGSCPPPVTRKPTGDKPANESRTQQQDDPRPQNIWGKGNKRSCSERHESNRTPKSKRFPAEHTWVSLNARHGPSGAVPEQAQRDLDVVGARLLITQLQKIAKDAYLEAVL